MEGIHNFGLGKTCLLGVVDDKEVVDWYGPVIQLGSQMQKWRFVYPNSQVTSSVWIGNGSWCDSWEMALDTSPKSQCWLPVGSSTRPQPLPACHLPYLLQRLSVPFLLFFPFNALHSSPPLRLHSTPSQACFGQIKSPQTTVSKLYLGIVL